MKDLLIDCMFEVIWNLAQMIHMNCLELGRGKRKRPENKIR